MVTSDDARPGGTWWEALFVDAPVAKWLAEPGPDGRILDVNNAACLLFGRSRERLLSGSKAELFAPFSADSYPSTEPADVPEDGVLAIDRQLSRPDGEVRWVRISARRVDVEGERLVLAHFTDTTEAWLRDGELQSALAFREAVLTTSPLVVSVFDLDRMQTQWASRSLTELMGYDVEALQRLQSGSMANVMDAGDAAAFEAAMDRLRTAADGTVDEGVARIRHADGTQRLMARRTTPFERHPDGTVRTVVNVSWDTTDTARAAAEFDRTQRFQAAVIAAVPDLITILDVASGSPVWSSRPLESLAGYSKEDVAALGAVRPFDAIAHPDDVPGLQAAERRVTELADGGISEYRYRLRSKAGDWRWLHRRMTPFRRDDGGAVVEMLVDVRDVTEIVTQELELARAATTDELTGIANRRVVVDQLQRMLEAGAVAAVLFVDVDDFKRVNDSLGHDEGDAVLQQLAQRLRSAVRPSDMVGRTGGDEFVVLVAHEPGESEGAAALAERICAVAHAPFGRDGRTVSLSVSIGIAEAQPGDVASTIISRADHAMYSVKERGKDGVAIARSR